MTLNLNRMSSYWNRDERIKINDNWDKIEKSFNGVVGETVKQAYDEIIDTVRDLTKINWLEPVPTYDDIAATYPNPTLGDITITTDDGSVYRYDGEQWVYINKIDPDVYMQLQDDVAAIQNGLEETNNNLMQLQQEFMSRLADINYKSSLANLINPKFDGFIPAQNPNRYLQSICYIPNENVLLAGYNNVGSDYLCDIVKFNLSDYSVINTYPNLELYHINDMAYNPNTNELLITPLSNPTSRKIVEIYDYGTMSKKNTVTLLNVINDVATIGYDDINNSYVIYDTVNIYVFDTSFNLLKTITAPKKSSEVLQSIECHNGFVYIYLNGLIRVYDLKTEELVREWYIPMFGECEGIAYVGNNEFLIGKVTAHDYTNNVRTLRFNILEERNTAEWITYSSLAELGLTEGSETIAGICESMSNKSILMFEKVGANTSDIYPYGSGILEVIKYHRFKVVLKFYAPEGSIWNGYYESDKGFNGWFKVINGISTVYYSGSVNDIDYTSMHYCAGSAYDLPTPQGTASYYLITITTQSLKNTHRKQIAYRATGASGLAGQTYIREMVNGVWTAWRLSIEAYTGTGSPENVVTAPIGSFYINESGGANTTLYIKTSGTGNTGWTAK